MSLLDDVVSQAVADFSKNGFDSELRLNQWLDKISDAAKLVAGIDKVESVNRSMRAAFSRAIERGGIERSMGIPRWGIEKIKPKLRAELDRRILANSSLIKLNREEAVSKTLRRFSGWATSIPVGGSDVVEKKVEATGIKQSVKDLRYIERRASIDQSAKLVAAIRDITAKDNGAIAATWKSHWRAVGYNYRKDHKERDEVVYIIRDSWAMTGGLIKLGGHKYTDEITMVGEEVYCQCQYSYIFTLNKMPDECLTEKGRSSLK